MSNRLRVDTSSWLPGRLLIGDPGFGVLGADIPAAGTDGPSYLYPCITLPADADVEVCGRVTRWPVNGTFTPKEDGSFTYVGTSDYAELRLHLAGTPSVQDNGLGPGIFRVLLAVGESSFAGDLAAADAAASGSFDGGADSSFAGTLTAGDATAAGSMSGGAPSTFSGDVPAGDATAAGAFNTEGQSTFDGGITAGDAAAAGGFSTGGLTAVHYAQTTDMVRRFSNTELVQITNRDFGATSVAYDVLEEALFDADAEIDAHLQARYALPLKSVPRLLVNVACDIARYRLYDDRATDQVTRRYEDALKLLGKISKGELQLGLDPALATTPQAGGPAAAAGGAVAEPAAPVRTFSRDTLGDYTQ